MPPNEVAKPGFRKVLGVPDGIAILIGIIIGSGIFSTPQRIAEHLPSFGAIIPLWIGVGIFVFVSGLIYAELGSRMPRTGGEYVYLNRCLGPWAGFMSGWGQLFIIRTSAAAGLALTAVDYFGQFYVLEGAARIGVAMGIIFLIGVLNYVGINWASIYQKFSTLIKVGGLIFIVGVGIYFTGDHENLLSTVAEPVTDPENPMTPMGHFIAAMMLVVFAHTGWERIGYSAGEMKNPQRVIPLSLLFGIGIIIILYLATNMVYHMTLGMEGVQGNKIVAAAALDFLIGPIGAAIVAILVIVSTTGSINGTMMTAPRVYYAMSRDGIFFKWLDYIHPRFQTPSRAIVVHCIWAAVILLIRGNFTAIVSGMAFVILIFYGLSTLCLFVMRREKIGEQEDGSGKDLFRMPLYPLLPAIFIVITVILIVMRAYSLPWESAKDLAFIVTGIPFAFIFCLGKTRTSIGASDNSKQE